MEEGWEPPCKVLGKEVLGEAFPGANDTKAVEELFIQKVTEDFSR